MDPGDGGRDAGPGWGRGGAPDGPKGGIDGRTTQAGTHAGDRRRGALGDYDPKSRNSMGAGTSAARKSMAAVKSTLDEAKWKTLVSFLLAVLGG